MYVRSVGQWSRRHSIAALVGLAACATGADSVGPPEDSPESDPVAAVLEAGDTMAYVSLAPGSVPGGVRAIVTNLTRAGRIESPMQAGGLDPVRLPARGGDSVEVETWDGQNRMRRFGGTVEMRRPPVVVRTGPAMGATDVSLNAVILVVFSGPMSGETITPETVQVTRLGEGVPVRITLSGDRLSAEVHPRELWPDQEYLVVVTRGAESSTGIPLAEEYRGGFRTANVPPVATVEVVLSEGAVQVGQLVTLSAVLRDAAGDVVTDRRITWSTTGPGTLDTGTVLRVTAPGEVIVTATVEGKAGTGRLTARPLRFTSITAGTGHTCGLTEGGRVYCWGLNADGQLGVGDRDPRSSPTLVEGVPSVMQLAAGSRNTCALDIEGNPYCWGRQPSAEFYGRPVGAWDWLPYRVEGSERLVSVSVGLMQACGRNVTGGANCWGLFVESDDGHIVTFLGGPQVILPPPGVDHISTGEEHSCGIGEGGVVRCWGKNNFGQLGDGTTMPAFLVHLDELAPRTVLVLNLEDAEALSAGARHTCAIDERGSAHCWGDNRTGQLGTTAFANECGLAESSVVWNCHTRPKAVEGGLTYLAVSAGGAFTCGLTSSGTAYCWGDGSRGQLGSGSRAGSPVPVQIPAGLAFSTISAGSEHACGLTTDRVAYCWGSGGHGELGNGGGSIRLSPVRVMHQ